jgi:hypothetical protein
VYIGTGLYTDEDIEQGAEVVAFEDGDMMLLRFWPEYCLQHNLNSEWAGILAQRCIPPPTKAKRQVMLYDKAYVTGRRRPSWTHINHSRDNANLEMRIPTTGCRVAWYATRNIEAHEELCFTYGGDNSDFDDFEEAPRWIRRRDDWRASRRQRFRIL